MENKPGRLFSFKNQPNPKEFVAPTQETNIVQKKPVRELLPMERQRIEKRLQICSEIMPEFLAMVKEFHELGMIDGYRSVVEVIDKRDNKRY